MPQAFSARLLILMINSEPGAGSSFAAPAHSLERRGGTVYDDGQDDHYTQKATRHPEQIHNEVVQAALLSTPPGQRNLPLVKVMGHLRIHRDLSACAGRYFYPGEPFAPVRNPDRAMHP